MKKFLWAVLALLLCMSTTVYSAGTNVITSVTPYPDGYTHVLVTFVADAADHTVPDLVISGYRGQHLYEVWTNPGTTQPTDNWDLYLKFDGGDILGGAGENRDTANTERLYPMADATTYQRAYVYVPGDLTLSVSGNSVNSATATVRLIFKREK
jgi:hypothetical protein